MSNVRRQPKRSRHGPIGVVVSSKNDLLQYSGAYAVRLIGLLLAFLACATAHAADWEIVKTPSTGGAGYLQLDRSSIVRKGKLVRVWTRSVYYNDFPIPDAPPLRSRVVAALTEIDCSERTETTKRVLYLSDDESPMTLAERGPYPTTDIVPTTPKEKLFAMVCEVPQPK